MDKENLKKYTCINLRCVTQSSKDGVLLNQLQNDYRQLLGTSIPFKELGYSSLEHFLRDIPDVICLKKKTDGSVIVEGVPDASTEHIAKLISKQKSSKKSKSSSTKPAVVTRTWGSCVKKNSHQNLKAFQKDFNILPSSTPDIKHKQNSKFMQLSPAQQELKKSVLINLRSIVQSCKDGVPLNKLQNDYRRFIGSNIPFENLGYSTLFEFIKSIPDVIELKEGLNEQFIAKGVVDAATAHLFGDILKPKSLKSPIEQSKPSVQNKATLQISSEQKAELPSFFKIPQNVLELSDLNNVLKHSATEKKAKQKSKLENFCSKKLLEVEKHHSPTEELKKSEPLKGAEQVLDSASGVSCTRTNTISLHNQNNINNSTNENLPSRANIVSTANQCRKKHSISPGENTLEKGGPLNSCGSSTSESNIQQTYNALIQPVKRFNGVSSKTLDRDESLKNSNNSIIDIENKKQSIKKNSVALNSKKAEQEVRRKDKKIENQIKTATISHMVWLHFVLYGPSNIKTLRKELKSFDGFPFSKNSTDWKGKINVLSLLPKKALQRCLYLLGIEFNPKDSTKSLRRKLIDSLASYTLESGTNTQETEQKNKEKELYASTLTLSSISSDVLPKYASFYDTENSDAVLNNRKFAALKAKYKISDSD